MSLTSLTQHRRWRYGVPVGALAVTAAAVVVPQLATGSSHPTLPPKTAAQLLAMLHDRSLPQFTGTVVETTDLGLPDISENTSGLMSAASTNISGFEQVISLLTGSHSAKLAYGGANKQRLALFIDNLSETDVVHNGRNVWTYSSSDNSFSHQVLPKDSGKPDTPARISPLTTMDPTKAAQAALRQIDPSTKVSVQRTAQVAGRSAYQLVLQPRDSASSVQAVDIAIDSATALPLRVQMWARGITASPALDVAFTDLHLGAPTVSTFGFVPPHGAVQQPNPLGGGPLGHSSGMPMRYGSSKAMRHYGPPPAAPPPPAAVAGHPKATLLRPGAAAGWGAARPANLHLHMVGKDWTTVVEGQIPGYGTPGPSASQLAPLFGIVDEFGSRVPAGRLLHTNLVSALVTSTGRFYIGAVSPGYLEQVAAQGGGK